MFLSRNIIDRAYLHQLAKSIRYERKALKLTLNSDWEIVQVRRNRYQAYLLSLPAYSKLEYSLHCQTAAAHLASNWPHLFVTAKPTL